MIREGFPLQWPQHIKRSAHTVRSAFKTTLDGSRKGALNQIKLMKGINAVITTNIPIRRDGQFYADSKPIGGEIGVAVYFTWQRVEYCVACDKYDRLVDNMRGCEKIIEAIRKIEFWGNKATMESAFKGFAAELPQYAGTSNAAWWDILGINKNCSDSEILGAYRLLAKKYHPDNADTGNKNKFIQIHQAYEQGLKERL